MESTGEEESVTLCSKIDIKEEPILTDQQPEIEQIYVKEETAKLEIPEDQDGTDPLQVNKDESVLDGETTVAPDASLIKQDPECMLEEETTSTPDELPIKQESIVADKDTCNPVGYIQCQSEGSKALLIYKGSTTSMKRHTCNSIRHSSSTTILNSDRERIRDKCVEMCALDLRPFNIVSGEGFISLSQGLIDIGAKYGTVRAQEILPSQRTVSRHIQVIANQVRSEILPKIEKAIDQNECAMTCDLWTDNCRKIHYLTVTSSIIVDSADKCELRNNVLLTTKFPDVSKTSENILTVLHEKFSEIDISSMELNKVKFVTDQGPNIRKAFERHKRLPCTVHCINTVLRHTFDEKFLCEELPDVSESIEVVRRIVGYMKRSGLVGRLEKTLHQDVETRWDSIYMMLDSFHSQKYEIENLLFEKNKQEMISSYQPDVMEGIIKFLEPFKEATNDLEDEVEPTLPFVVPWTFSLLDTCQSEDEIAVVKFLKGHAEAFLKEKVMNELQDSHYMATVLHPYFKELLVLSEEKKENVYQTIRQKLNSVVVEEEKDDPIPFPIKKFRSWRSSTIKPKDELEKYLNMDNPGDNIKNLLLWWKANACSFPKLFKVAKEILCIPASSATSKRNFSRAGLIVSEKRSCIDPDRVNDILLIHNNKRVK